MYKVNLSVGKRHVAGRKAAATQLATVEKLQNLNPDCIVFDLDKKAVLERNQVEAGKAGESSWVQIVMQMDPLVTIALGDGAATQVKLVERTLGENAPAKPEDALFMLQPSAITALLQAYASDADGEGGSEAERLPSDEECAVWDLEPDQLKLET